MSISELNDLGFMTMKGHLVYEDKVSGKYKTNETNLKIYSLKVVIGLFEYIIIIAVCYTMFFYFTIIKEKRVIFEVRKASLPSFEGTGNVEISLACPEI